MAKSNLRYVESGNHEGPLMVFIHGGGVSGWMWQAQVVYFKDYHCLVPTLAEHGLNNQQKEFSIHNSAKEMIDLIKDKGKGKKVIVVGFSLGAQIIVEMLGMAPTLIDYGVINSALVRPMPLISKMLKPILAVSFPLIKYRWFAKLQAKELYIGASDFETYYAESRQITLAGLTRVLRENMSFEIPPAFAKSTTNILVMVGQKENKSMLLSAKALAAANSNSLAIMVPKVGHGISLAEPAYFNHLVAEWLKRGELPQSVPRLKANGKV